MAQIIDGKALSDHLLIDVSKDVQALKEKNITPTLAVVLIGDDPASHIYVKNKIRRAETVGITSIERRLAKNTSQILLNETIDALNKDPNVHGILVQLPLPNHLNEDEVIASIDPAKDVDGFHPINVGALTLGKKAFVSCTPAGCMIMLKQIHSNLSGLHAVVIGRSNIVGKPMASLLLRENCTVTIVHSQTQAIESICRQADILIAAVGVPELVKADWVKEGATVIDVGINAVMAGEKRQLKGDVDFSSVKKVAGAISPVPGGVGPMTIACLMQNTLIAAKALTA